MLRLITAGDRKIMRRVNQWEAPRWIRKWMVVASRAGDGWLWITLGAMLLLFGGERRFDALQAGFVSVGAGLILFWLVKRLTGRERPCATEAHCWANLLPPDRFSFPSGHTITAFAVAVPIGLYYPTLLAGLIFCAVSVASSRVLLGLHYLSDVLAGILIGCLIGVAAFLVLGPGL
ncbi:MAG TPA: phosphatase PAP2 family protein [Bryobacteraceae bacterium]|jgi:undecaprenyl-diphosphatase|nr:phosphatase PAP2 family protein [Bryobacteraceae bacterium]